MAHDLPTIVTYYKPRSGQKNEGLTDFLAECAPPDRTKYGLPPRKERDNQVVFKKRGRRIKK